MEVADFFWYYWWEQEKGRTVFSFEISQVKHLFKNMLTVDFMIDLLLQTFDGGGLQCLSSTYTVGKKKKKNSWFTAFENSCKYHFIVSHSNSNLRPCLQLKKIVSGEKKCFFSIYCHDFANGTKFWCNL